MGDYGLFVFHGNDPEDGMQLLMQKKEATPERATFRVGERVGMSAGPVGWSQVDPWWLTTLTREKASSGR